MDTATLARLDTSEKYIPTNELAETKEKLVDQTFGSEKPKYYVLAVGGSAPTRIHFSRFRAEGEARRLAARFPDRIFHVVKVKSTFIASKVKLLMEEALSKLALGMKVRVGPFHYRNAGENGEIIAIKDNGSVEVMLDSKSVFAFAPTSLYPTDSDDQAVGGISREQVPGGISQEQEPGAIATEGNRD